MAFLGFDNLNRRIEFEGWVEEGTRIAHVEVVTEGLERSEAATRCSKGVKAARKVVYYFFFCGASRLIRKFAKRTIVWFE